MNINDDSSELVGDHLDRVADLAGLARVPRITREQASRDLSPMQLSFLGESRRLVNRRLKRELRLRLRYPSIDDAFRRLASA
jgi:hypothetical protein